MMRSISIHFRACAALFTSRRQLKSPAIIKAGFPVSQTFCSQIKGLSQALRSELWQISSYFIFLQRNKHEQPSITRPDQGIAMMATPHPHSPSSFEFSH